MTTHFGAGAGQATEDAYILGRLLAHPAINSSNVTKALQVYDAIRRPIANAVVDLSLRLGLLYEFAEEHLPPGTDAAKLYAGDRDEVQRIAKEMDDIWTLMIRTTLLMQVCTYIRENRELSAADRAQLAVQAWLEIDDIEGRLERHTCNLDAAYGFQAKEMLFG